MINRLLKIEVNRVLNTELTKPEIDIANRYGKSYVLGQIESLCNISDNMSDKVVFSRILCLATLGLNTAIHNVTD